MNTLKISNLDARNVLIALDEMRKQLRGNKSMVGIMALDVTEETDRNIRMQLPATIKDDVPVTK